jgi:hypothetical protein
MKKVMNILMLSCIKATELIEKKTCVKLSFWEKGMLGMHKSMCSACTAYEKQSKLLDKFLQGHIHDCNEENIPLIKNAELKRQIISKL